MTNFGHMNLQAPCLLVGKTEAKARKAYQALGLDRQWGYAYFHLEFAGRNYEKIVVLSSDHLTESEEMWVTLSLMKKLKATGGKLIKI